MAIHGCRLATMRLEGESKRIDLFVNSDNTTTSRGAQILLESASKAERAHPCRLILRRLASLRLVLAMIFSATTALADPTIASIKVLEPGDPVTKYAYGMFIEPIGDLIARTLWAEMLDDRKFYYPILAEGKDAPAPQSVEAHPGITYRRWRPIGGDEVVVMDGHNPFVGQHSACVAVDRAVPRGFGQTGIGVVEGKHYSGHILLNGDAGASVHVALIWGAAPVDRQVVSMPILGTDWRNAAFEFVAGSNATNARFEITGVGTGQFCVG